MDLGGGLLFFGYSVMRFTVMYAWSFFPFPFTFCCLCAVFLCSLGLITVKKGRRKLRLGVLFFLFSFLHVAFRFLMHRVVLPTLLCCVVFRDVLFFVLFLVSCPARHCAAARLPL
ncbi:hypothetical protein FN846DRAFT_928102 [Sphaerosporella brunnea]|uniref:Uncharacterized protein n=1 Tax=Sphaerosporella brunnea TaxID=1250544 RepID=A0A5J5FA50_9PEZI|nr:hypothetical protein FN846DRAFT_928102 [Sphaerosporella brunnea]